jgi:hypothetical protein
MDTNGIKAAAPMRVRPWQNILKRSAAGYVNLQRRKEIFAGLKKGGVVCSIEPSGLSSV